MSRLSLWRRGEELWGRADSGMFYPQTLSASLMTVRLDQEPHIVIASLGAVPEFVYDRLGQFEFRGLINQCRYNVQSNTV